MQIEWGKLIVLSLAVAGAVLLLALGRISEGAGVGIITGALGYTFGNGRLMARGKEPVPMIRRRPPGDEADE